MPLSRSRLVAGVVMTIAGLAVGFMAGGMIASRLVGAGDGLAGAATVALVALATALGCAVLAGWLAARLPLRGLAPASAGLLILAVALIVPTLATRRSVRTGLPEIRDTTSLTTSRAITVTGGDSLLGLLQLGTPADGSGLLPAALDLHGGPGEASPVVTTVTRWSDLVAEEISYEEPAIAIFRVAHPWFMVETRDSIRGWVRLPEGATVVPLVELLPNRLNYLTAAWDGQLHAEPGRGAGLTVAGLVRDHGEASAEVHEARQIGDALWLRVTVHRESPCETGGETEVLGTGWVPAWTAGEPTAWFYSRGC